jgi:hypothetical protein
MVRVYITVCQPVVLAHIEVFLSNLLQILLHIS